MKRCLILAGTMAILVLSTGCNGAKADSATDPSQKELNVEKDDANKAAAAGKAEDISAFAPKGKVIFDKVYGDLNKDGAEDCVLIIKGTDKSKVVKDEYRGDLDRNRRGIVVLFKTNNGYELAIKNDECFSSENEDGGVYYAPELSVEINKGNLYVSYAHGRYGYWNYTFRYQNSDFELIGYDASSNTGPVVNTETSINYSTGKKITKQNTNENADGGDEVFKETVTKVDTSKRLRLSAIKDFDELDIN